MTAHKRYTWEQLARRAQCPECGQHFFPNIGDSYTYPGSDCDRGDCFCPTCEDGEIECLVHADGGTW